MKVKNVENNAHKGEYKYEYKSIAGNFKELKGFWALVPIPSKKGWTEFRGEYKSDPGISVPHFLAKTVTRKSLRATVKDKIKVLEGKTVDHRP